MTGKEHAFLKSAGEKMPLYLKISARPVEMASNLAKHHFLAEIRHLSEVVKYDKNMR